MTTSEATTSAADTRTVVQSYFEALGRADRNAQTDWYADDARGHTRAAFRASTLAAST
jgi:hypothetical protein